ncbi:MAG: phosphoribosyltransferase family protein [Planctomycetota bacterium]
MRTLADASEVQPTIDRLAGWVTSLIQDRSASDWAVVGIRSRGEVIAQRVARAAGLAQIGVLDITLYRDDLADAASQPTVRTTEIDFPLDGLDVVLIDDVLMTGRSVRAALDSLMDLGRPRRVWLAVLVDRGPDARELPIAADFAGLVHPGPGRVAVRLTPTDPHDAVLVEPDDADAPGAPA